MYNSDKIESLTDSGITNHIRAHSYKLTGKDSIPPLLERIGDARIVMLGEASHGTHEYYTWRMHISQQLIREKGFNFIAVEGDWPDCYCVNRYIKNYSYSGRNAHEVLNQFDRWPTWMWANWETVALAEWLCAYNKEMPAGKKAGFYGLDVYSLWESMDAIRRYLQRMDKTALKVVEKAVLCFEPYRKEDGQGYARASRLVPAPCETEVVDLLKVIRRKAPIYPSDPEEKFSAGQNALVAVNAEKYYRAMIGGDVHSWNVRDRHMADTLDRLLQWHGPDAKAIIWEHNTHVGDARATDMKAEGMVNIGELARLKYPAEKVVLVGFGSYEGEVMAGSSWGSPMRKMQMPPAKKGSWEYLLRQAGAENRLLIMEEFMQDIFLENEIGHRAIGVVYNPGHEQYSNYVPTILPRRYDAFIYLDHTNAVHPLHIRPHGHQVPDTYPFGV